MFDGIPVNSVSLFVIVYVYIQWPQQHAKTIIVFMMSKVTSSVASRSLISWRLTTDPIIPSTTQHQLCSGRTLGHFACLLQVFFCKYTETYRMMGNVCQQCMLSLRKHLRKVQRSLHHISWVTTRFDPMYVKGTTGEFRICTIAKLQHRYSPHDWIFLEPKEDMEKGNKGIFFAKSGLCSHLTLKNKCQRKHCFANSHCNHADNA